jgi:hypothetical protein
MNEIQAVANADVVRQLEAMAAQVFDEPWHLRAAWIIDRGWIVVPVEKGRHFEEDDAARTARAMRGFGYEQCYAVATEPMDDDPHAYSVPATRDGLIDFSRTTAGLNFILIPQDLSFAVLCTSEDYNLYAGSRDFVELALGTDVDSARAQFREIAADEWWQGRLLQVSERYEALSAPP